MVDLRRLVERREVPVVGFNRFVNATWKGKSGHSISRCGSRHAGCQKAMDGGWWTDQELSLHGHNLEDHIWALEGLSKRALSNLPHSLQLHMPAQQLLHAWQCPHIRLQSTLPPLQHCILNSRYT